MSRSQLIAIAVMGCFLLTAGQAAEETIHFREGGGTGYTDVTFDDTKIDTPQESATYGDASSLQVLHSGGHVVYSLMAIKDLFVELPKTTGGQTIDIKSATLHLTRYNAGSSGIVLEIYPITTDWLPDDPGSNENDVCYGYSEKSQSTQWASGGWSGSDYDTSVCSTGNWVNNYNEECEIDVTDVIAEIYDDETNYGWMIDIDSESSISYRASENGTLSRCPSLEITYEYVSSGYTLTVNSGTGDGTYDENDVADIAADTPPSGQDFDKWVGDTSGIASQTSSSTTLTMPAADQEVTATYTDKTWTLTVNSGTGDGDYVVATVVDIDADTAPSGQNFDEWVGDTEGIASLTSASTTLTMPYVDAEITATYTDTTYTLTVNSGTGDGEYSVSAVVDITADAAASGSEFDAWSGDVTGIADPEASATTITMPGSNAEITATYITHYTLTVNSGTGDGTYEVGAVVDISADDAPTGEIFEAWVGDTSNIADVGASSTSITMPASDAEITATYTNLQWTLTVNSGAGDGDYDAGTVVDITADAAPSGYAFEQWTGETATIADVNDPTTTLTMPTQDTEVTAGYTEVHWDLTVNNGSGDGDYAMNTVVDISADGAASGKFFDKWIGDTSGIADINDSTTTLTMPGSDAEITATYADVADGLVSRYTFDIDARDTCGANDGTLSNGASVSQDGQRGPVLSLDGDNDYVELPSANMAAGRSELTLSLWIKPDVWTSGRTVYDEYAEGAYWQFSLTGGTFYTRDSSTGTMGTRDNDLSMPAVPTGQWHHIAVVYSTSGSKKAIYYDGSQYASTSTSIDTLTSTRDGVRIGYPCDGTYYDGLVDDVRLYGRALNNNEIALLADSALYTLTVNSGSGDGDYTEDTVVNIAADAAPSGQDFDEWGGDTDGIANVSLSSTTITMPAADAEITATYTDKTWTLTVNSGTGDGSYVVATVVDIDADTAPSGKVFDEWTGETANIASVSSASTTITMPYADAEITATYTDVIYTLTVNSGSGDGDYTSGTVVNISADGPASGKVFDEWVGDTSGIANVNASSTTLTMPAANQEVTATYEDGASGTETIHFREGGGTGYTDVTFDDTYLNVNPADNTTHGNDGYNGIFMDKRSGQTGRVALLAVKDLFSELPKTNGGQTINIQAAALHLVRYQSSTDTVLSVNRITTNWLPDSAGANENDVSGEHAEVSESTDWSGGDFSSSDYDTSETATETFSNDYNGQTEIDVTELVKDIYNAEANYGFVLQCEASKYAVGRASENSSNKPSLEITYYYGGAVTTYTLTVNNGSGDGSYAENAVVGITADSPASGNVFDEWVGDTTGIASLTSASTTITMPAADAEITATYEAATLYTLTVNSGSGDGSYQEDWVVDIAADTAPSGQQFDEWVGDTSGIADVNDGTTALTMPAANAEITAVYTDISGTYTLTVNSGTGDGSYQAGTVVNISADSAPSGMAFDDWAGDTANIADVNDPTTTITMPAADAEITATYGTLYTLTVNSGSGDGDYIAGTVVNVSADTPASGKTFDDWVGDTADVANVYAADTTVTMPSDDVEVTATYDDIGSGPSISFTTGTWSHGSTVTVNGSSFGSHADYGGSRDFLCRGWFDFETGGLAGGNFTCENSDVWDIKTTGTRNNSSYHGRKYYNGTRLGAMYVSTLDNTHEFYSSFWINLTQPASGLDGGGKIWRIWSDIHSDNIYLATGGSNTMIRGFSESTRPSPLPSTQWSSPDSLGYGQWHRIEIWMDDNPSEFTLWMDGVQQWTQDNWVPYPWYSGTHTWQFGHMINDSDGGGHNFDDLFADNTRARVEVGNASTWPGCTQREPQIPKSWSSTGITIEANKGSFSSFSGKYLYVVDSNGNVSTGYYID